MKAKHTIIACLTAIAGFTFTAHTAWAQENTEKEVPQKVETPVKVEHSVEWYKTQERLWKAEIDKNPKNEEAWKNYYYAVRYKGWYEDIPNEAAVLTSVIEDMGKAIPETYTLKLLLCRAL